MAEELTQWDGKVALSTLSYRGFSSYTHWTLFGNYARYGPEKIALLHAPLRTEIHRARSMVADQFLRTKCEYLIMCDDDMLLPYGDEFGYGKFVHDLSGRPPRAGLGKVCALSKIMSHPKEVGIVGALYFSRNHKRIAMTHSGLAFPEKTEKYRSHQIKGLQPEEWMPTGFIRIARWVFEKMVENAELMPEIKPREGGKAKYYGFFTPGTHVGEDASFGKRAKLLGINSFVDADIVCYHVGETAYGPN